MRFAGRIPPGHLLFSTLLHRFSSSSSSSSKDLRHVPPFFRPRVLLQAKEAVAEYFHTTRSLPFSHAEHIAANSPSSLSAFLSAVPYSSLSEFPRDVRRHLAFGLINEFDFFFESIGVPPQLKTANKNFFLSDDSRLVGVVSALVQFGFPWTDLGVLYKEESSIFELGVEELAGRLSGLERYGLDKACLIAICLAFPSVLGGRDGELGSEVDLLFRDLKWVLAVFDSTGSMEENVEAYFKFCRRIRVFYDFGCKKGEVGELMRNCWRAFLMFEEQELFGKVGFFCRLGMEQEEAGMLLLRRPEVCELDLENTYIRMPDYLLRAGFGGEKLNTIQREYPYVMGRNKFINLPDVLKALGLGKWLTENIKNEDLPYLSHDYLDIAGDNKTDAAYQDAFASVRASRKNFSLLTKLEFLQGIGFGENKFTIRALKVLNGSRPHLQERFDCLLDMGIEYSELCKIVNVCPKILNQKPVMLREKVDFLCNKLGFSVQYLSSFPAYLTFDLENRIKPRYRMLDWLREQGLLKRHYTPASIVSSSEKQYIHYLKGVHPAAPKLWFEVFKFNNQTDRWQGYSSPTS